MALPENLSLSLTPRATLPLMPRAVAAESELAVFEALGADARVGVEGDVGVGEAELDLTVDPAAEAEWNRLAGVDGEGAGLEAVGDREGRHREAAQADEDGVFDQGLLQCLRVARGAARVT